MGLEYDADWPGLTEKNDAGGSGSPELNRTEIKRIAGELRTALDTLITPTPVQATQAASKKGSTPPELPGPPSGAGSLPDLRRECKLTSKELGGGGWLTAEEFTMSMKMAYGTLIGEGAVTRGGGAQGAGGLQAGSGTYASMVMQADLTIQTLLSMVESYDVAEQANGAEAPREV
ncbi:hypothetical protein IMZ11_15960 [Microtetraspora sp. AC03309]|uniref:hypothetical protein n=1 Tax=Microtetraspora sp. AC03309 TaxID=2779376 RepID=UPI001E36A47F|nr:hypothetical protein [Microtetraspora sp. AC03309]MCC5577121.1 hypothetical protein [Microtetraspora sp. AC03309]